MDIITAGTLSCKLYDFRKILEVCWLINGTVMMTVAWNALWFFTGCGSVFPFSVDLSDFSMSFRVESNTTIKIYIGHDVLFINELRTVIRRNNTFFEVLTSIFYKIIFRLQNGMNCKLCGIIRRDLGFIVVVHRFLRRKNLFNFDKG